MSSFDPYLQLLKEKWNDFKAWVRPDPDDKALLRVLKTAMKIPIILLAILVSPIALIILLFAFIAAF